MGKTCMDVEIAIDYPKLNETITSSHYTFRLETNAAGPVEVSIDDGPWMSCRPAVGYWWFDWQCGAPGKHKVAARLLSQDGSTETTSPRYFFVVRENDVQPTDKREETTHKAPARLATWRSGISAPIKKLSLRRPRTKKY